MFDAQIIMPTGIILSLRTDQISREKKMILAETACQMHTVTASGIGLGAVIAVVASWQRNKSLLWAILHGILSWIYVIYFALTRQDSERK
jgi:hydroxyethylthiazole kinase-like sugar kinase family protein